MQPTPSGSPGASQLSFGDALPSITQTPQPATKLASSVPRVNRRAEAPQSFFAVPLHEADGGQSRADQALAFLAKRGIEIDSIDANGIPALIMAAWDGQCDIVEALLLAGASVNAITPDFGDSPLILAASLGHLNVVNLLLGAPDVDLGHANMNGDTALMVAVSNDERDVVKALLAHGADASQVNPKQGHTALMLAGAYGLHKVARLLVATPTIALNAVNGRGDTALILASTYKHREVVRCLLDAGADATVLNRKGYTALSGALAAEDAGIIELFLERGHRLDDFNAKSERQDAFSVTVCDLVAGPSAHAFPSARSNDPLAFFIRLSKPTPVGGDTLPLLCWLRSQGLPMACAQELVAAVAPAHGWASEAVKGARGNKEQNQLMYCIGALRHMAKGGADERVLSVYRKGRASSRAVDMQGRIAREKFDVLAEMAGMAAAQVGSELTNRLIALGLAHTNARYEVRLVELENSLISEGFIKPLATLVASCWQTVLAKVGDRTVLTPTGLTMLELINYLHQLLMEDAQLVLANALKENLTQRALLTSFEAMLVPGHEEVLHTLFQIQCDWLLQFCEQSLES